jgi:hypothetical protein
MTPPCVVPTFRPYTSENLEFGGSVPRVAKVGLANLDDALTVRPGTPILRARAGLLAISEALTEHAAYFEAVAPE